MKQSHEALSTQAEGLNVLVLCKGEERYVIFYEDCWTGEAYRTVGRWASNPELSFDWKDAAELSRRIRDNAQEQAQ